MRGGRFATYKIQCLTDGKIFNNLKECCEYYNMTKDQISYRLDAVKDYKDGMNFIRLRNDEEALKTAENVDSKEYVDKLGDQTVPIPGYEDRYTISTKGVITNTKSKPPRVLAIKTKVVVKNTVILHSENKTQVHSVEGLLKRAFGDLKENT